jgi:uncharacterized protein
LNYDSSEDRKIIRDEAWLNQTELLIEAKRTDPNPGRALINFHKRYEIPGVQLVLHLKREKKEQGIEIRSGMEYLKSLLI